MNKWTGGQELTRATKEVSWAMMMRCGGGGVGVGGVGVGGRRKGQQSGKIPWRSREQQVQKLEAGRSVAYFRDREKAHVTRACDQVKVFQGEPRVGR